VNRVSFSQSLSGIPKAHSSSKPEEPSGSWLQAACIDVGLEHLWQVLIMPGDTEIGLELRRSRASSKQALFMKHALSKRSQ
jgi:hypothetical protein